MLLSIIIVSYNSCHDIKNTLQSLINQTYQDFEVIIIDGASEDNSLTEFEKYTKFLANTTIYSEKDNGIYDAMNKGVKKAVGDYVYFLNLGDSLYDKNVLKIISDKLLDNYDFVYGNYIRGKQQINQVDKITSIFFLQEKMICHQTLFVKRDILLNNPFNVNYKYCADRDFLYNVMRCSPRYLKVNYNICCYDLNGFSSNVNKFQEDSIKLIYNQFGLIGVLFVKLKRLLGEFIRGFKGK